MASANIRETLLGIGKITQADLVTRNLDAELMRLSKLNATVTSLDPIAEDDAQEIGKGSEFAQNHYLTSWSVSGSLEKYLSSEMASWLFAMGFGKSAVSVVGGATSAKTHTATVADATVQGLDCQPFTVVEQVRPGSGTRVIDRAYLGCCLEDFTINLASGPGRASSKFSANFVGTGGVTTPSGVTMPSAMVEHLLPAAGLALTVNGTDYITAKSIIECSFSFKNNIRLDTGYYPGSGFQTPGDGSTGQIRGRMEFGDRVIGVNFVARLGHLSTEHTNLVSQTEGALDLALTGSIIETSIPHSLTIHMPRIYFSKVRESNANGIITVEVEAQVLLPSGGSVTGMCSAVTVNTLTAVGAE